MFMKRRQSFFGSLFAVVLLHASVLSADTLKQALDAPSLDWTTGGSANWGPESGINHDAVSAAQSGLIGDNQESWIQTQIIGPAVLTYWWKVSCEEGFDTLEFYMNSNLEDNITGEVDWQKQLVPIPPGTNVLRWRYVKDASHSAGGDAGWLDSFALAPSPSLNEALDTSLPIATGGQIGWFGQTATTSDGIDAAQSGPIKNNQNSLLDVTVVGPVTLTFWWKVSSEEGYDFLEFYRGTNLVDAITGEVDWTQKTYQVPSGTQRIRWRYVKDASYAGGDDMGWVDQIATAVIPYLGPLGFQTNGVVVPIQGLTTNLHYQLLASSNLVQWAAVTQWTAQANSISLVDPATSVPKRFYRVISP
jgi:hypothetical protein